MTKFVKHTAAALTSVKALFRRAVYCADQKDKNHTDKLVLPSRNHNCAGNKIWHFLLAVLRRFVTYLRMRQGRRGKRTAKKWVEIIYSSENGKVKRNDGTVEPCLDQNERDLIEKKLLAGPIGCGSGRLTWHLCLVTGRCDLHMLTGIHDENGTIWLNNGFGHGGKNLKLALERIEEEALCEINRRRPSNLQLQMPRQVHVSSRKKAGKKTLAQKLAKIGWHGEHDKLAVAVKKLGYKVIKQTAKTITVESAAQKPGGKEKRTRYNIATLAGTGGSGGHSSSPNGPQNGSQGLEITGPDM